MASADLVVRPLRVWFKGNRTYLHGTDLFNLLVEVASLAQEPSASGIRLSIYHPMTRGVEAVLIPPGVQPDFHPAALLEFQRDSKRVVWAVRETPNDLIAERRLYDEELVTAGSVLEAASILQPVPTGYSFIERVVALNKRLLDHARPEPKPSWWFSRLELFTLPPLAPALRLERLTDLGGRLVKSSIEAGGTLAGYVFFSEKVG
jgi:hypothetical protein